MAAALAVRNSSLWPVCFPAVAARVGVRAQMAVANAAAPRALHPTVPPLLVLRFT